MRDPATGQVIDQTQAIGFTKKLHRIVRVQASVRGDLGDVERLDEVVCDVLRHLPAVAACLHTWRWHIRIAIECHSAQIGLQFELHDCAVAATPCEINQPLTEWCVTAVCLTTPHNRLALQHRCGQRLRQLPAQKQWQRQRHPIHHSLAFAQLVGHGRPEHTHIARTQFNPLATKQIGNRAMLNIVQLDIVMPVGQRHELWATLPAAQPKARFIGCGMSRHGSIINEEVWGRGGVLFCAPTTATE